MTVHIAIVVIDGLVDRVVTDHPDANYRVLDTGVDGAEYRAAAPTIGSEQFVGPAAVETRVAEYDAALGRMPLNRVDGWDALPTGWPVKGPLRVISGDEIIHNMDQIDLNTVLVALRYLQADMANGDDARFTEIAREIAGGEIMDADQIEDLCERLNFGGAADGINYQLAVDACNELVEAYDGGAGRGGSVDWEDLDRAHDLACEALGIGDDEDDEDDGRDEEPRHGEADGPEGDER